MNYPQSREEFYELMEQTRKDIASMDIPDEEKEKQYACLEETIKRYEEAARGLASFEERFRGEMKDIVKLPENFGKIAASFGELAENLGRVRESSTQTMTNIVGTNRTLEKAAETIGRIRGNLTQIEVSLMINQRSIGELGEGNEYSGN